jgi:hypothetical protein
MMRAVWSFWSKPFAARGHEVWLSEKHHLLAWALSVMTAQRHYRTTALLTDDAGARLLVDGIGLKFDHLSTAMNELRDHDPDWWALGKMYAYRSQTEPFVHIDNDVFLWRPLSPDPASAAVLAQNPEYFLPGRSYYRPEVFEHALAAAADGWLPVEWQWYRAGAGSRADCCGVFGGNRLDFIRHYAAQAIRLIEHPINRSLLRGLHDKVGHNILFEQFLLAACVEYHRNNPQSLYCGVTMSYVFASLEEAFDPGRAERAGFTHLIADAKRNPHLADRVEARLARDHPAQYRRCIDYLERGQRRMRGPLRRRRSGESRSGAPGRA